MEIWVPSFEPRKTKILFFKKVIEIKISFIKPLSKAGRDMASHCGLACSTKGGKASVTTAVHGPRYVDVLFLF